MVRDYIILAISSIILGVVITFVLLGIVARAGIDLNRNIWLLAIPAVLALLLNVILLEIYRKFRSRK